MKTVPLSLPMKYFLGIRKNSSGVTTPGNSFSKLRGGLDTVPERIPASNRGNDIFHGIYVNNCSLFRKGIEKLFTGLVFRMLPKENMNFWKNSDFRVYLAQPLELVCESCADYVP